MNRLTRALAKTETQVIERLSPVTGKIVSTEPALSINACAEIVAQAAAAFPAWSAKPVLMRKAILVKASEILRSRFEELCAAMIEEIAAPVSWAAHNVTFAAEILTEVASYAEELGRVETVPDADGIISQVIKAPCGVCLGLAPWNAPLILGARSIAAPLLCGNTMILKGNEIAPRTYRLLGEVMHAAGVPEDALKIVLTRPQDSEAAVEYLIKSPVVRRVNFTGSTRVGRRVAELCAQNLKRPLLELGGQANMIVLDDADLDAAAQTAVNGAYMNQGQICMSTERLIVIDSVANDLVGRIEVLRSQLILGDPADPCTQVGPVISKHAAKRLELMISDARSKGATLIGGGTVHGASVEPTLLDNVEDDMRLYHEEVFGPILSVTRVRDDAEALTVANESEYGLASAVFGRDLTRATTIAHGLHSGICHINGLTVADNPHAPFGGVKASGYGRFGGRWALHEFAELRWITTRP